MATPTRTIVQTIPAVAAGELNNKPTVVVATPTSAVVTMATPTPVQNTPVGVVVTRPVQHVTQIRLQTQPVNNALQKKGLALTVSYAVIRLSLKLFINC